MGVSVPCTKPEISRAATLQRAEEGSGTDFAAVLQAAWWGIFHRRPEKGRPGLKTLQETSLAAKTQSIIDDSPLDLVLRGAFPPSSDPGGETHGDSQASLSSPLGRRWSPTPVRRARTALASVEAVIKGTRQRFAEESQQIQCLAVEIVHTPLICHGATPIQPCKLSPAHFMKKDLFPCDSSTHREWGKQETGMLFSSSVKQ